MTLHRFFIPPEWIRDKQVTLSDEAAHQARNVLRLRAGDRVVVLDDTGWECEVELSQVDRDGVKGQVIEERQSAGEPRTRVKLYQSVLKARKFELVLQKGTELGIVEFVPLVSERSVVGDVSEVDAKQERWRRVIREAAEQSRRGRLPVLRPTAMFAPACQEAVEGGEMALILSECEETVNLKQALGSAADQDSALSRVVSLFVGPEGGFTPEEVYLAEQYGARPVGLGPRILRAETAGLVAASAVFYELEP
jgi:16S rRNA (uracil1498-N3)-methyltransferase